MNEKLKSIIDKLPEDWETLEPELQIHHLVISAGEVLQPKGNFILLNSDLTIRELLKREPD